MRPVFLIGFMAAGKTTVGRLVAARLGVPFVDLDDVVTEAAGTPVRELFAARGEAGVPPPRVARRCRVADRSAPWSRPAAAPRSHGDNLAAHARGAAWCVDASAVSLDTALPAHRRSRPAVRCSPARARRSPSSTATGSPTYRQAHAVVATDGKTPDRGRRRGRRAGRARRRARRRSCPTRSWSRSASAPTPSRSAPARLARLGALARAALGPRGQQVALVTDSNVDPLHGDAAARALAAAGLDVVQAVVPAGETAKSVDAFAALRAPWSPPASTAPAPSSRSAAAWSATWPASSPPPSTAASRASSCRPRWSPWSTAAIGGKTGIDLDAGKNLVGAFQQPRLVLADPDLLATLPGRERRAAFGELLKYALLDGEELYGEVDALAPALAPDEPAAAARRARRRHPARRRHQGGHRRRDEREQARRARAAQPRPHRRPRHRGGRRLRRAAPRRGGRARPGRRLPGVGRARPGDARARGPGRRLPGPRRADDRPRPLARARRARPGRGRQEAHRLAHRLRRRRAPGRCARRPARARPPGRDFGRAREPL